MENNNQPDYSKKEIVLRMIISLLLLGVAIIGYLTLIYSKELKNFNMIMGVLLILWSFYSKSVKGFALNMWIMRIGGMGLILSGIMYYLN